MSVSQAQACIDSAEFAEWIAFHKTEPFTINRVENMLGIVAAILSNSNRSKGSKTYAPEDFIPKYGEAPKDSAQNLETKLRAILNGNH